MGDILERAKAALEGITEGPWRVHEATTSGYAPHYGVASGDRSYPDVAYAHSDWEGYGNGSRKADAEFIAAARTLVPELVAEVERLREHLKHAAALVMTQGSEISRLRAEAEALR